MDEWINGRTHSLIYSLTHTRLYKNEVTYLNPPLTIETYQTNPINPILQNQTKLNIPKPIKCTIPSTIPTYLLLFSDIPHPMSHYQEANHKYYLETNQKFVLMDENHKFLVASYFLGSVCSAYHQESMFGLSFVSWVVHEYIQNFDPTENKDDGKVKCKTGTRFANQIQV